MKKIGVLTSGGDSPGMNAAIRAVVRAAIYNDLKVVGIKRGYEGLINGDIENMSLSSVADIIHRGGTMLRTARSEDFKTEKGFSKALNVINIFGIDGIVVIGGDGSFRGAEKLSQAGISTIGLPGTIDNDLAYTDYTIGFDTAINTVLNAISNIRDTSTSHGRANIIEVMGRHCGDIALYAGLAGGAESIIVPEEEFSIDEICKRLIQGRNRGKLHSIILLAEGVVKNSYEVASEIEEKTGIETKLTILGHIQRGGSPTAFDRILASRMAGKAVELILDNKSSRVIGIKGNEIIDMDISEALTIEKKLNQDIYRLAKVLSI
ncbi:6-phosphofructokinase [Geosporobacter ferrireducens]|uniref:ATP-dependent 6-phosphofructokinase n=1 Tax=Geosporobacter ferrireducens TaxID=1424294 RepID=A0A1D8GLJ4_9FIRM|nr:6-phosphofructokinase [Geosporobacter ferrireducens]AOT71784.1 6-phosphofructokinase [Geosporobacter ferrireducens]MTI55572.1 6-phosphofructokinase [Geosporobacter ferrireducens]